MKKLLILLAFLLSSQVYAVDYNTVGQADSASIYNTVQSSVNQMDNMPTIYLYNQGFDWVYDGLYENIYLVNTWSN